MRNKGSESVNKIILSSTKSLPYFRTENLKILSIKSDYLKISLSRLLKKGAIIRLKKGFYVSREFVEKARAEGNFSAFLEFLAGRIYPPSYLSLDYVLYENNILTEIPRNLTLITRNKTAVFSNKFGVFIYHKIKDSLFSGFETKKISDFFIYKATKAKSLFDFLYLRKKIILNREMAAELRLNLNEFTLKEKKEFEQYVNLEGSGKMKDIYDFLFG